MHIYSSKIKSTPSPIPSPSTHRPPETPLSSCSLFSTFIPQTTQGNTSPISSVSLASTDVPQSPLVKPRKSNNSGVFNVRTLAQIGQQASLAITLSSLNVDICCFSETLIQDSSTVRQLSYPNSGTRYSLRLSGDDTVEAPGRASVSLPSAIQHREHLLIGSQSTVVYVTP